jgi:hypothetical protein
MANVPDTDSNLVQPPQKGTKFAKIQLETKCGQTDHARKLWRKPAGNLRGKWYFLQPEP